MALGNSVDVEFLSAKLVSAEMGEVMGMEHTWKMECAEALPTRRARLARYNISTVEETCRGMVDEVFLYPVRCE